MCFQNIFITPKRHLVPSAVTPHLTPPPKLPAIICTNRFLCYGHIILMESYNMWSLVTCFFYLADQISRSVVSDSLRPHESQHARPPVHHQLLEFTQTHVYRVSDAIQPSHPLSSPSPPAPNPSQHQSLFQ